VINDEKFTDVNIKSYGGNINDWNEVVEAEVESRGSAASDAGKIPDTLHFKLYSDDGEVVDIKLKASSDKEGENIEPNQVNLESLGSNYEI